MIAPKELAATLAKAVVIFTSTNVDDIVILTVLFADPRLRPRVVVMGQYLGIAALVVLSVAGATAALAIPAGWLSLVGVVPLGLGVYKGVLVVRTRGKSNEAEQVDGTSSTLATGSQVLAVAAVTLANGGDNLGVYIPVFAVDRGVIGLYAIVFAAMTALWCALGSRLVNNRAFGGTLRRYGHIALPIVLVVLGIHILAGLRVLCVKGATSSGSQWIVTT